MKVNYLVFLTVVKMVEKMAVKRDEWKAVKTVSKTVESMAVRTDEWKAAKMVA